MGILYYRVSNEPNARLLAFGDCARVKYPATWGGLAKEKLSHAPLLCSGGFDFIRCICILFVGEIVKTK